MNVLPTRPVPQLNERALDHVLGFVGRHVVRGVVHQALMPSGVERREAGLGGRDAGQHGRREWKDRGACGLGPPAFMLL